MSNRLKTKFAGLLRSLLLRFDENEAPVVKPPPVTALAEPVPTVAIAPAIPPPSTPSPVQAENVNEVELPLPSIFAALPMDLRSKIMKAVPGGATLSLSVEKILPQLASGSVKITFGELRHAAPDFFISGGEHDVRPVILPLNEILARLNPALLARRPAQKQIEVADEISGPFGARGQGATISSITKPTPPPAAANLAPFRMTAPETLVQPTLPPVVPPPSFLQRTPKPAASVIPSAPAVPKTSNAPAMNAPEISAASAVILAPLAALLENWPESLKLEIAQLNLLNAQVALPMDVIEPALKRGRVVFPWRNLRAWIKPVSPSLSAHDGVELELPLKVLAPLFFARQKTATVSPKKISVAEEIPNLFFGFPQPVSVPLTPVPSSVAAATPPGTNFFTRVNQPQTTDSEFKRKGGTDFRSRGATPDEIVSRAAALSGVAGALVALPDGLKVASRVPPDLNADTLAAFLPQIFGRVTQCSKELRMGELNNLNFTVGNVPWKIFRVNAVYFAAFGRAGEPLPTAQLALLAAELDHKKI